MSSVEVSCLFAVASRRILPGEIKLNPKQRRLLPARLRHPIASVTMVAVPIAGA